MCIEGSIRYKGAFSLHTAHVSTFQKMSRLCGPFLFPSFEGPPLGVGSGILYMGRRPQTSTYKAQGGETVPVTVLQAGSQRIQSVHKLPGIPLCTLLLT